MGDGRWHLEMRSRAAIARRVSWPSDGRYVFAAVGEGDADLVLLEGLVNPARE